MSKEAKLTQTTEVQEPGPLETKVCIGNMTIHARKHVTY